jgi:hypothetical protein
MLYLSKNLLAAVRKSAASINEERRASQSTNELSLEDSIQATIAAIPGIIAAKQLDDLNCAEVMTLVRDRDFELSGWKDRKFSQEPQVEHLSRKAAKVFAYCAREGLNPHFARFLNSDRKHSAIIIDWKLPEDIVNEMMGDTTPGAFINALCDVYAAAIAKQALVESAKRASEAMSVIGTVRSLTSAAANQGQSQAKICRFFHPGKSVDFDALEDQWVGDVAKYCRTLGLDVQLQLESDLDGWAPCTLHPYGLWVSGWKSPPAA